MKKKILIVASSLATGGLEKCLISLCSSLDYSKYEVDLYLFNEGRALLPELHPSVRLLPDSPYYATVYNRPVGKSFLSLVRAGKLGLAFYRLGRFIRARLGRTDFTVRDFKTMKSTMLKIQDRYDVAIGFEEGTACYYVAECVSADRKIGWIHTDIKKINSNRKLDERAFSLLDAVVTVSDNSRNSLAELYPAHKDKLRVIRLPALIDGAEVARLAKEPSAIGGSRISVLSVGRLVELKGHHLCVEPLKRLVDLGYDVKWYVAGEGDFRGEIEARIRDAGVEDRFILLGNCKNPYAYIARADIVVQPSSYEGFSVAVLEAKHLRKPVVATSIPSNLEMITDGENGLITERTSDAIFSAVKKLIDDPDLRARLGACGANGDFTNEKILNEIEALLN